MTDSTPATAATSIREWQTRAAEWTDSRFPDDDLKQRGLLFATCRTNSTGRSPWWLDRPTGYWLVLL